MNEIIKDAVCILVLSALVWLAFYLGTRYDSLEQRFIRYDCRLAEFAPDIPTDVKLECRRRALEQYNNQQPQSKE